MTKKLTQKAVLEAYKRHPEMFAAILAAEDASSQVTQPEQAAAALRPLVAGIEKERFAVLGVDRRYRIVDSAVLTEGSDAYCIVDPKQIFRWALTRKRPVAAVVLAHNHPSGDPTPSAMDFDITERVVRAGRVLGIHTVDHLTFGHGDRVCSMAAEHSDRISFAPAGTSLNYLS